MEVAKTNRMPKQRKLEYWIRLGMLLLRLVERYGYGVLLLLPESMTDAA